METGEIFAIVMTSASLAILIGILVYMIITVRRERKDWKRKGGEK